MNDGLSTRDESPSVAVSSPATYAIKLWDVAYTLLQDGSSQLLDAYETMIDNYIAHKSPDHDSDMENDVPRRVLMDRVIQVWLTDPDNRETTISNRDTHMEGINYSLQDILRQSLERSGNVSLPWAAACLAIESIFCQNSVSEAVRSGIIEIVSKMEWYIGLSGLLFNYNDEDASQPTPSYYRDQKDRILELYTAILRFTIEQSLASRSQRRHWALLSNRDSTSQLVFDLEAALIKDLGDSVIQSRLGQMLDLVRSEKQISESDDGTAEIDEGLSGLKTKLRPIETRSFEAENGKYNLLRYMDDWAIETEEYKSFFQRQHTPDEIGCDVLWVSGPAGAGKTMLMRAIVQRLLEEPESIANANKFNLAYFFCDSREKNHACATQVLKSLIWQMLKSQPSLAKHMERRFLTTGRDTFNDPNDFYAMSTVLYDMLNDADDHGNRKFGLTYVIVDGIEELGIDNDLAGTRHDDLAVRNLLGLIINTAKISQHIKWLVSIEPSKVARELTPTDGTTKLRLDIDDRRHSNKLEDIIATKYIPSKLSHLAQLSHFREPFQSQVTTELIAVAPPNFLWVDMACHRIKLHRLPWNAIHILRKLPRSVNELYKEAYERISKLDYPEDQERCHNILSTTAIAYRALTKSEVQSFLELPADVDLDIMVREMCSSFLEIYNGSVCYTHPSARDFIRQVLANNNKLSLKHSEMTERCLRHATIKGGSKKNPYATINWIRHMWATLRGEYTDVFQMANLFLDSHFLEWTETLAKQGLLAEAIILLQRLNTSLKTMAATAPTEQRYWLRKVEQALWLLNFHQSIKSFENLSPRYSLPFLPSKSELRQKLLPKALPWLDVPPDIEANAAIGRVVQVLKGHDDWVRCCCYSPDGSLIASGGDDGLVRLWDAETFKMQHTFELGRYIHQVLFTDQHLVVVLGATIKIWNTLTGAPLKSIRRMIYGEVDSSPDGKKLIAASERGILIFNLESNTNSIEGSESTLELTDEAPGIIESVKFSPDGALIAYSRGQVIFLRDMQSGKSRRLADGDLDSIQGLDFSPNSKYLASCCEGGTVRVWDTYGESGKLPCILKGHRDTVRCVSFSPDASRLASGSADSTIIIWKERLNGSNPTPLYEIEKVLWGHNGTIRSLDFEPAGQRLISSSYDTTVMVWDIGTLQDVDAAHNELKPSPQGHDSAVCYVSFSPNGSLFASAFSSGKISLWNCNNGHLLCSFTEHGSDITWLDFSCNGRTLVSASTDTTVRVWDTDKQIMKQCFHDHSDWVRCAVISPDGTRVASVSDDCSVRVWNIESDNTTKIVFDGDKAHTEYVRVAAFCPNGDYLASGGDDLTIMIWDVKPGGETKKEPEVVINNASEEVIQGLAFTKDESRIVSSEFGGVIRIWNRNTKICEQILDPGWQSFRTIQFDDRSSEILITEVGAWPITIKHLSPSRSISDGDSIAYPTKTGLDRKTPPDWCPYGMSNDRKWITWNNKKLIYLPAHYRSSEEEWVACRVKDHMVVIGTGSGQVLFFKFSSSRTPEYEGDNIIG
ncbi:hypothetical protein F4803DRAFT_577053 [Xylaria telfairii]|nr:hypothetical protein F4803DRAFT_577053 [Xylaria telfairii]